MHRSWFDTHLPSLLLSSRTQWSRSTPLADTLAIVGEFLELVCGRWLHSGVPPRRPWTWQCRVDDFGSMAMGGGTYLRDKNTCARTSTENVGGACTQKGTYMRDATVYVWGGFPISFPKLSVKCFCFAQELHERVIQFWTSLSKEVTLLVGEKLFHIM